MSTGPLSGVRVVEFAGIGPTPFCGMLLSDLGADVVRIDRPGATPAGVGPTTGRGRRSIALNLKDDADKQTALKLIAAADALIEGFRPGVMERLGLGPTPALAANPRLVYGRMTGWGQTGPLADRAGHDLNYIALTGALHAMGRAGEPPAPPLNLLGDYGGGAMFLVFGLLAGVLDARTTGRGQVVDAAMTDGVAAMTAIFHDLKSMGLWSSRRADNLLDGAAPFYDVYICADGAFIAVGAIEPEFYALLLDGLGLSDDPLFKVQLDKSKWPEMKMRLQEIFVGESRDHWAETFEGGDACVTPVLSMEEAAKHPHNAARGTLQSGANGLQPAPAPRFSGHAQPAPSPAPQAGEHSDDILRDWEID